MPASGPQGVLYNTAADSGVPSLLAKITGMVDTAAANQNQLRGDVAGGRAPANMDPGPTILGSLTGTNPDGTPAQPDASGQSPSVLSSILGMAGLGAPTATPASQAPPVAPTTTALQGTAPSQLQALFQQTEKNYGLPSGYLAQTAAIESRMNPNAVSPTGAMGPFGFTKGTAAQYGLQNPTDWAASTNAAGRLGADNTATMTRALGRPPTAGELYLAHQQGAVPAAALIKNPTAPAGQVLASVGANPNNIVVNGGDPNAPAGAFAAKFVSQFGSAGAQPQGAMAYAGGQPQQPAPGQAAIASAAGAPAGPGGAAPVPGAPAQQQGRSIAAPGGPGAAPQPGPMPQATAATADPNGPGQAGSGTASALPANGAPQTGAAPQGTAPQGSLYSSIAPPPTTAQIQAMVANPATRADGIALWKNAVQLRAPITVGNTVLSGTTGVPLYSAPVDLAPAHELVPGQGGAPIASNSSGTLPPDALETLARRVANGDSSALTGIGRGPLGAQNVAAIQTRAGQIAAQYAGQPKPNFPENDILANQADQAGAVAGARTSGEIAARADMFGGEATQAMNLAIQASRAVPRTTWTPLNAAIQKLQAGSGDPQLAQFAAASNAVINTYAKSINPSGVPTDSDKAHARDVLSTAQSPEAFEATVQQLQREVNIAVNAARGARAAERAGTAGAPASTTAPPPGPGSTSVGVTQMLPGSQPAPAGATPSAPVRVNSAADAAALPSGTQFITPNGQIRVRH